MVDHVIGETADFGDGTKTVLTVGGTEVGIFRLGDDFFAWHNRCPHQGGPVCQGRLFKRVLDKLGPDQQHHGRTYDDSQLHIVCPWHGAEFDVRTGIHAGMPDLKLEPVEILVSDKKVYVRVE